MKNILRRALAITLVLCMLAISLIGCGSGNQTTYKTYFSTSYPSLNYFSTSYATVREIATNCIDGLVEPDIYGNYVPSMAESWEHNEDYTVWTFKIRKDLNWIDQTGAETEYAVTAQDFVDGIRYIGDPLNGAYSLRVVRNLITGLYD
jgi:oligopeptide transport system substrate-binding protein